MERSPLVLLFALPLLACDAAAPFDDEREAARIGGPLTLLPSREELIDFDSYTYDSPLLGPLTVGIKDGRALPGLYPTYIKWFDCFPLSRCPTPHAYARRSSNGTNGVSVVPAPTVALFDSRSGEVYTEFKTPRRWVSIDARAVLPVEWTSPPTTGPEVWVYDMFNQRIAVVRYPRHGEPGWGTWLPLRYEAGSDQIRAVRLMVPFSGPTPVYGEFDNLRFDSDPIRVVR